MNPLPPLGFICLLAIVPLHAKSPVPDPAPDIWELRYHASGLDPAADSDSDGHLNADEATAGTDPLDSTSYPRVCIGQNSATSVFLDIVSQPEKAYQVIKSPSPAGPWTNQGGKTRAQGDLLRMTAPMSDVRGFFRVVISDDDTDRDGLTDWEEHQLAGFDAHDDDSFGVGKRNSDFAIAAAIQAALWNGQLQVAATKQDGIEEEQAAAVVTFTRTSDTSYPFTLFLRTGGTSDPAKTAPSPGEFTLADAAGHPISGSLVIPPANHRSPFTSCRLPTPGARCPSSST